MKKDGIHFKSEALQDYQDRLHRIPEQDRRREIVPLSSTRRNRWVRGLALGSAATAAAALATVIVLRFIPSPTDKHTSEEAQILLQEASYSDLVDYLESSGTPAPSEELEPLLTEAEWNEIAKIQ